MASLTAIFILSNFFQEICAKCLQSYGSCGLLELETPPRQALLIRQDCQMAVMASVAAKSKMSEV